ncbi:hypothetical protein ACFLXQ_02890 [Chloroflexota bacterium]
MSCETNSKKVGLAGALAGLSAMQQKIGYVSGAITHAVTRNIGLVAGKTLSIAESFDGPGSLDSLSMAVVGLEAGARFWPHQSPGSVPDAGGDTDIPDWLAQGVERRRADKARQTGQRFFSRAQQAESLARRLRHQGLLAVGALKLGHTATIFAGTGVAHLTKDEKSSSEQRFFFPNTTKIPVGVWPSSLTPLLNRLDSGLGLVRDSGGMMLEIKGQTWHRGTLEVSTAQGERTITHIQSMSLPQQHYYFSRRLSDNEAVGTVTGQKGFDPKYMDGYIGQISEVESLVPTWARIKKSLIRGQLLWGGHSNQKGRPAQQAQTQAPKNKSKRPARPVAAGQRQSEPQNEETGLFPLEKIGDRVSLAGQDYPVIVRRVVNSPANKRPLADAAYYDAEADAWKVVTDEEARSRLANQVRVGAIQPWPVKKEAELWSKE